MEGAGSTVHPPGPAHTCDVEDAVSNGGGRPGTRSGFGLQDTHHGFQLVQCLLQARVAHGLLAGHLWETRALPSLTRLLTPSSTPCPSSTITLAIIGWPPHLSEFSKPPFVMQLENAPQTLPPPPPPPPCLPAESLLGAPPYPQALLPPLAMEATHS